MCDVNGLLQCVAVFVIFFQMQQGTAGLKEVCPGEKTMLEAQDLLLRKYSLQCTLWKTVGAVPRLLVTFHYITIFAVCRRHSLFHCFIWLACL